MPVIKPSKHTPHSEVTVPSDSHFEIASYQRTIERFDTSIVASNYPPVFGETFRERREVACIKHALRSVPAGGDVLDLPCGTGRLIPLLAEQGFYITAADASPHMLALAERCWLRTSEENFPATGQVEFVVREVLNTGFEDNRFDGVICNRLFHHFNEPETRIAALTELGRICRGTVMVSFFNSLALDAVKFRLKHLLRRTTPSDRIPIPRCTFEKEAQQAGLKVIARNAVMWGLSPMWFLTLQRK